MIDADVKTIDRRLKENEKLLTAGKRTERQFEEIYALWVEEMENVHDNVVADNKAMRQMGLRH